MTTSEETDIQSPWWNNHENLAATANFMKAQGADLDEVIYMLEKPHKHTDDFNLAMAEMALPEDLA